jgi:membrane-bound ClpP family serine protease
METYFSSALCLLVALFLFMIVFLTASIRIVREDTRLSVYRLGRYIGEKGPGIVLLIPIVDRGIVKELGDVQKTPSTGMVGVVGETTTSVFRDGKVLLSSGEEWDAVSQTPISIGRRVRVVRMVLEVEEE